MPYQYVDDNGVPGVDPATQTTTTPAPPVLETAEQRYARLYPNAGPPAPAVTPPVTAAPVVATLPPEVLETITALKAEISGLKEATKPVVPPVDPNATPVWVEKIKSGDFNGATEALAAAVQKTMQPTLENVRAQAYQEAVSATQVNLEIDRHVQKLRMENPELVSFEKYLQAPVAAKVEEARANGKIKSPTDFIREYKSAIDAEVTELRNLGLVLRGQGRQEAQTRNQQVIASTTLVPNQVQSTQAPEQTQTPPDESMESYFARRRSDENRRRGLSL